MGSKDIFIVILAREGELMSNFDLVFEELTEENWPEFERLFGRKGACGGCWCRYWKGTRKEFNSRIGEQNRVAQMEYVLGGNVPGILAFADERPVGWCAIEPRSAYSALARSRILVPVDDQDVWSITCFFIQKSYRRKGISVKLLNAAVDYVRRKGGVGIEGYPVEPRKENVPPVFAFTGLASAFIQAGFQEVARRSETRPIFRIMFR